MYNYKAQVIRVVDGDTADILLQLGFNILHKQRIRLYGINAPESRTRDKKEKKRGLAAKARLKELIDDKEIFVHTHKQGKFGRYLAEIYEDQRKSDLNLSVNRQLVKEGHAKPYFGGRR